MNECPHGSEHKWVSGTNRCESCGRIRLFHVTDHAAAEAILQEGYKRDLTGADFSDEPVFDDEMFDGDPKDSWLVIDVEESEIGDPTAIIPEGRLIMRMPYGERFPVFSCIDVELLDERWIKQIFSNDSPDSLTRFRAN